MLVISACSSRRILSRILEVSYPEINGGLPLDKVIIYDSFEYI